MTLILNKKVTELARASVSKLSAHLEMLGVYKILGRRKQHNFLLYICLIFFLFICLFLSDISDGDLTLQGSLGSLSLSDLTPHGDLYRERFTTHGEEALSFNIIKYIS